MRDREMPDPLLDEIREIRARIWAEHGDDPDRLYQHYVESQKQYEDRSISRTMTPEEERVFRAGLEELRRLTPEDLDRLVAEEAAGGQPPPSACRKQDKSAA